MIYYDGNRDRRVCGDGVHDSKGYFRSWDNGFYDGKEYFRRWGEGLYDLRGYSLLGRMLL